MIPTLITDQAAIAALQLKNYDLIGYIDTEKVLYFEGDTVINGHMDGDWACNTMLELTGDESLDGLLVVVKGNLTVMGDIRMSDYRPSLLVQGNVECDVLKSGDETIHITGDARVKYAYYGYYNDGSITIEGTTYVPYVFNSDHASNITPEGAILINIYSDHDDFFEYDFTDGDLPRAIVPAAFDERGNFKIWKCIDLLKAGQPIFKEGVKPARVLFEEELALITSGNTDQLTELDWSDKKLKEFPLALTKLTKLKRLRLSKNNIRVIPEEISVLTSLEELYVDDCGLSLIGEGIGNLKKLERLDISSNFELKELPVSFGELENLLFLKMDHVPLVFPESTVKLQKLEEISMYGSYNSIEKPAVFPEVLLKLKGLKKLELRKNWFFELPEQLTSLSLLEEFLWTDSRTSSKKFPDFTQFKFLKKLVISGKLNSWKEEIFKIPSLEHLVIDRNKEEKQYFTRDTLEIWKEMAPEKPAEFNAFLQMVLINMQPEQDGRFSYISRHGIKPEDLQDIDQLPNLRYLDLSYNNLTDLPDSFFTLSKLEYVDLRSNLFTAEVLDKIKAAFPKATLLV